MAVVKDLSLFIFEALIFVLTFFGRPVVPETLAWTATFSVNTFCWSIAGFSTSLSSATSKAISYPWVLTNALFCWRIPHFYTFSIIVTVFTRIIWDWDTVSVIDTFVSLFTLRDGTFILDFASAFNAVVSSSADTVTDFLSVAGHRYIGCLSVFARNALARIDEFRTDESVTFESSFTFTVIIGLSNDLGVRDTVSIFITSVFSASINRLANKSISVITWFALALVIDLITNNLRITGGIIVTASVICLTGISWDTLSSLMIVTFDTVTLITRFKIFTGSEKATECRIFTIIDHIALFESISVVVFFANAVVTDRSINTCSIFVTFIRSSFTLIYRADKSVVESCLPAFPFSLINGVT